MKQLIYLIFQGTAIFLIAVPQRAHSNSCSKVQILFSIRVVQINPFPMIQNHRETVVGVQKLLLRTIYVLLFFHLYFLLLNLGM